MDKTAATEQAKRDWKWLPREMPGVAKLIAERRQQDGSAWVNECWKRGVEQLEPGWFFAVEGALMVGVLGDDAKILALAMARLSPTQSFLMLKTKEAANGA